MLHEMLYLPENSEIPFGVITSTARKGTKWFEKAEAGDILDLRYGNSGQSFGTAVVQATRLLTYRQIIERAAENHTGQRQLPPGETPASVLAKELHAAYGENKDDDLYTMVSFVRLKGAA